jgi:hypothetical protein
MVGIDDGPARDGDVDAIQIRHGAEDKQPEDQKPAHACYFRRGHGYGVAILGGVFLQDMR